MKNWVIQGLLYDFHPSPLNFIKSKWYHFHFCKKDDPTITAALYLDNLADELKHEKVKQTSVNKKSLTLSVIKKILENKEAKQKAIILFEKKEADLNKEIKMFLENVASLIHPSLEEKKQFTDEKETVTSEQFPARTYIIATHMFLEINHNELHYETLIRDTSALKEFITATFKTAKISDRIADMKNFSYKKLLQRKNNTGAQGQLKPQLKQIISNPQIFGKDVSEFAADVLKENFEESYQKT